MFSQSARSGRLKSIIRDDLVGRASKGAIKAKPDPHPRYQLDDPSWDVEDPKLYRPGGLMPVYPGNTLGARYKVLHKLGHDIGFTLWLARDQQALSPFSNKLIALKILTDVTTELTPRELLASRAFRKARSNDKLLEAALQHVHAPYDSFEEKGTNGKHRCYAFELLGASVTDLARYSCWAGPQGRLQAAFSRKVIQETAAAVGAMHQAGVVHGGKYDSS
jgi:serine/threonine-protein kinase SRPK3